MAGIRFFSAKYEMRENMSCKLYKIDETFGSIELPHAHDYVQIWYVSKGTFKHIIQGREYTMMKGSMFVVPPYAVHGFEFDTDKLEIYGCEFHSEFFDYPCRISQLTEIPKLTLSGANVHRIQMLFQDMVDEYEGSKDYYEFVLKGSLLKLLSYINRENGQNTGTLQDDKSDKYWPNINRAVEYIQQHYDEEIRLDYICKYSKISKTYFCHLFKSFTGKTFNDYLTDVRINKSTEFLLQSDLTVTDVCYGVGFNDLTYFSKTFKKYTGVSPSIFKKNARDTG
ncbi:AraC family transcriptional regulator [Paenibacillus mendelii]|uniref:Helix-turn-helix domain-containing protein n=1 Tax=Paenibacillus mendelii TaxID=206163 RepID=A0ABV6JF92_9BACL|nr:AraC family transcriptional regulator [Paenibacillus mendelii]MCQ6558610.1 AraC family transcriptional regulator [Paenibacillus mendelii]